MSFSDVKAVLTAELMLLAQCDGIKEKFDEFIKDGDIEGVPGMFFMPPSVSTYQSVSPDSILLQLQRCLLWGDRATIRPNWFLCSNII